MKNPEIYLNINKETLDKTEKEAIEEGDSNCEEADCGKDVLYPYVKLILDKSEGIYFDDNKNTLHIAGDMFLSNKCGETKEKFGYASIDIPLDMELIIDIIEGYRKKLGKLKTILEATK